MPLKQFSFAQFCCNVNSKHGLETMFFFKILMFPWQTDSMWGSIVVFIAIEDRLCSFSDRHGSPFKIRLSACLGVFIPIPHPTAFFIHVSVRPLDILISSWTDRCGPMGYSLKAAVHFFGHAFYRGMGLWRRLYTSSTNTTRVHVSYRVSQLLLRGAPWGEPSLGIPCSCAVEFSFRGIPEHPFHVGHTPNPTKRLLMPWHKWRALADWR